MTESTATDKEAYSKHSASASGSASGCVADEATRRYYLEAMGIQCWQSLQPVQENTQDGVPGEMLAEDGASVEAAAEVAIEGGAVSYTHLTLPTMRLRCRSRWSPCH